MESNQPSAGSSDALDKALAEYERAQEIGHHTDIVLYEITAIVWGANTLLLGFILEVGCDSHNQWLVLVAAVLAFLLTGYVPLIEYMTKKGQRIAYEICRQIENDLPLAHRLNNRIHDAYPKWRPGQTAVWVLTLFFLVAWFIVGWHAWSCAHTTSAEQRTTTLQPATPTPSQDGSNQRSLQGSMTNLMEIDKPAHNWVDRLNAISTAVVAVFTVVLACIGIAQFSSTKLEKRAWMVVKSPEPPTTDPDTGNAVIRWQVENRGRTPAWVTSLGSTARIVRVGDALPEPPTYTMAGPFPPKGTVLPPKGKASRGVTIPAASMKAVEHGQEGKQYELYVFGIVGYKDIYGTKRETRYCYLFKTGPTEADPAPRDFYVGGPSSYNGVT
jgi:hypothetical protein